MASQARLAEPSEPTYDGDASAWALRQAELMMSRRPVEFDWANIAEELRGLSTSEFKAFTSAIEIVLVHMLKWDLQPERRGVSWVVSILNHRDHADESLRANPSFKPRIGEATAAAWRRAFRTAASEMGRPLRSSPKANPYTWDDIMTRPFDWPEEQP